MKDVVYKVFLIFTMPLWVIPVVGAILYAVLHDRGDRALNT